MSDTQTIYVSNSDEALLTLRRLVALGDLTSEPRIDFQSLRNWARTELEVLEGDLHSQITPAFMKAFLELQDEIYRLVALGKTGVPSTLLLDELDKHDFRVIVSVSGGSSKYKAEWSELLEKFAMRLAGKLNGTQATIVIIGLSMILACGWAFSAYLQHERDIRLEELKSKEHLEALEKLSFADKEKSDTLKTVLEILKAQGEIGNRIAESSALIFDQFVKAAASTDVCKVNGVALAGGDAVTLRVHPRKPATIRYTKEQMRVVDINTGGDLDAITFVSFDQERAYKTKIPRDIFATEQRPFLFRALENREYIWVELALREVDGELRAVDFLRVTSDPTN